MNHNDIINNDLIDKYLLNQLTEEEENGLEEHLLFCDECMDTLEKRKAIIGIIRNELPKEINQNKFAIPKTSKKPVINFSFLLKIAATLLVLVSITWLGILLSDKNKIGKNVVSLKSENIDTITFKKEDSTIINKEFNDEYEKNTNLLAEAYKIMPEFENFIENSVRAGNLEVLSPKFNYKFKPNEIIKIRWESADFDSLNFIVFDNKANIIFEKQIDTTYLFEQKLKPGLYYWQLETTEESVFTGKFIIRN